MILRGARNLPIIRAHVPPKRGVASSGRKVACSGAVNTGLVPGAAGDPAHPVPLASKTSPAAAGYSPIAFRVEAGSVAKGERAWKVWEERYSYFW